MEPIETTGENDSQLDAFGLSKLMANTNQSLEYRLSYHFALFDTVIPESLIPVCAMAIYLAKNGCDLQVELDLPAGVKCRGKQKATAQDVIDGHYLQVFVDAPDALEL